MQKQKIEFPYILHPASPNDNNLQNHSITIKRRRLIKLLIQLQTLFGLHSGGMYFTLVAQTVKNLPAVQETWVPSLGREDPLENGMTTHSSILAWRIPWTEGPVGLQSVGLCKELDMTEQLSLSVLICIFKSVYSSTKFGLMYGFVPTPPQSGHRPFSTPQTLALLPLCSHTFPEILSLATLD